FRDGTRVAASPPALTAAMCGGNAVAVREALDAVLQSLGTARDALDAEDPIAALTSWLRPGATARAAWPPVPSEPATLPVQRAGLRLGRPGGARGRGRRGGGGDGGRARAPRRPGGAPVPGRRPGGRPRRSVTIAVTSAAGVTSKAGLTASAPSGAVRRPRKVN